MENIIYKTNGYDRMISGKMKQVIKWFNYAVRISFIDHYRIEHFYYGDKLDMITVYLDNGHYGDFNLKENSINFNGHTCSNEEYEIFSNLTWNDPCFPESRGLCNGDCDSCYFKAVVPGTDERIDRDPSYYCEFSEVI